MRCKNRNADRLLGHDGQLVVRAMLSINSVHIVKNHEDGHQHLIVMRECDENKRGKDDGFVWLVAYAVLPHRR